MRIQLDKKVVSDINRYGHVEADVYYNGTLLIPDLYDDKGDYCFDFSNNEPELIVHNPDKRERDVINIVFPSHSVKYVMTYGWDTQRIR